MSPADEQGYSDYGDTGHTRTRLPDNDPYGGAPRRPTRSPSRGLITVVGVVVLLIAAIAFANRGDHSSADSPTASSHKPPTTDPTAASGTRPVQTKTMGIPTGFAHSEQGAQSAASNYAVALGSTDMFKKDSRQRLLSLVYVPDVAARLQGEMDRSYTADFLATMGLDANGNPPKGSTFVARVTPVGATVQTYTDNAAKVAVWYVGLIGMAGNGSTDPVTSTWKTWTFDLRWSDGDWKIAADTQKNGPSPVPGDDPAATSDQISKAIEEYGGFTYAR
ncbi:hypothetical protein SAMN04490357_4243 [Streptomyces misionensis]|uniref:DUF8175 domain-containing protein n=1 Tax=Streptomyces misionensis TaxID=67331 RepID=A0A1H4Z3T0_9ACTN|nr:hypothetical protein [Streptomyces misionensis]SED24001.1 hypothetical protein SAMN04490357_4243 [Streptomyces misionensis]